MLRFLLTALGGVAIALIAATFFLQAPTDWKPGEIVRTPDERFANLPDYPFAPNYVESLGYRIHYVDEGPKDGPVILLLHGQPSWSYLYRHMIPPLAAAGYRVIAPDLVGFGRSDKPLRQSDYSYQMHIDVMTAFIQQVGVEDVTFFGQDWGGLIGLRIVAEDPDRFARIMISNTGLPAAGGVRGLIGYPLFRVVVWREGVPETLDDNGAFSFTRWVAWSKTADPFDLSAPFQLGTVKTLSQEEIAAYAAPFPEEKYLAGARIFPYLVPSQLRQNEKVMREFYANWDKPFLTAFSDSDPVTAGGDVVWREIVPGAQGQPHTTIKDGGHFIQEDRPGEVVQIMIDFIQQDAK